MIQKSVLLASLHQGYHQYFDNDDQITNSTTRTNKSTLTNRTSPEISTNGVLNLRSLQLE